MVGTVNLTIDLEREEDGRWIAEAVELPGVLCYGQSKEEAIRNAERLAIDKLLTKSRTANFRRPPSAFHSSFLMNNWPASKAKRVLAALERIGWRVKRQRGSHRFRTPRLAGLHLPGERHRLPTVLETHKSSPCAFVDAGRPAWSSDARGSAGCTAAGCACYDQFVWK
jgi:predicted RNase H-like HicB family nuclease